MSLPGGRGVPTTRNAAVVPWAVLVLVLVSVVTSCSDGPDDRSESSTDTTAQSPASAAPGTVGDLDGTRYVSTAVQGHELVEGTDVELSFGDGVMTISAGCNTIFGAYEVESDTLRWSGRPASTLKGCADDLEAQDRWLTTLLADGATVSTDGSRLTLTAGDVTVELSAQSSTDLTGVLGRTWTLVETIAGGVTSGLPRGINRPFLSVRGDGLARLNTGCNVGRTTVRVDGDQLVFGHATITRRACQGAARSVEETLLALVDEGRTDEVEVRDGLLIVTRDQRGLVFSLTGPSDT
jgi:heat shock protein HslJ